MKIAVVVSKKDIAGMNIAEELEKLDITPYYMEKDSIDCEGICKDIEADAFIFATRHQSKEGKASLTTHCPGNWGTAEYGGKDKELCISMPKFMKKAYELMKSKDTGDHIVTMEVTHHGPYLEKPCMFIEIGSCEEHWKDKELGKIMASVIKDLLSFDGKDDCKVAIGIGGTHYCSSFNKLLDKIALGHVCPKYALENLDSNLIDQAISRNMDKVDFAVIDWKSMKSEVRKNIISLLEIKNIEWKKTSEV